MVPAPRALVFDLDGTLVDSLADIAAALNHVLAADGLPQHPLFAYRQFVGEGMRRLVERAAPGQPAERIDRLVEAARARYRDHLLEETRCYPGVTAALAELAEHPAGGLPLAILSNKPQEFAEQVTRALLPEVPFLAVEGERPGRPRKPDPAGALAVAEALGVAPDACWLVGDTRTDMDTARAAGMVGIGVLWGFRDRAELEAHGAAHVLGAPAELPSLVRHALRPSRGV